jgi:hypothetical protein
MGRWRVLLDETVDPAVATALRTETIHVETVRDALGLGADDEADLLPYAREYDLVIVTSDVTDFAPRPDDAHAGLVLVYDDTMPAHRVTAALRAMIDAYPDRDAFDGQEILDDWA